MNDLDYNYQQSTKYSPLGNIHNGEGFMWDFVKKIEDIVAKCIMWWFDDPRWKGREELGGLQTRWKREKGARWQGGKIEVARNERMKSSWLRDIMGLLFFSLSTSHHTDTKQISSDKAQN